MYFSEEKKLTMQIALKEENEKKGRNILKSKRLKDLIKQSKKYHCSYCYLDVIQDNSSVQIHNSVIMCSVIFFSIKKKHEGGSQSHGPASFTFINP